MNHRNRIIVGLALTLLFGCGQSGIKVFPATGTVTFQGKAVEGAFVSFVSKDGVIRNASGITDASGKFELQSSGATRSGAMLGEYIVFISKSVSVDKQGREIVPDNTPPSPVPAENTSAEVSGMPLQKQLLPEKYNIPAKPVLYAMVVRGKNHFTFDLDEK